MSRRRRIAIGWTALIVIACSIPGKSLPEVQFDFVDKSAHFVLFFVFGWLWVPACNGTLLSRLAAVSLAGLVLAAGTEVYQGLLPINRSPDGLDAVANAVGLIVGIAAVGALERFRRNEKRRYVS